MSFIEKRRGQLDDQISTIGAVNASSMIHKHASIEDDEGTDLHLKEWNDLGRPEIWELVESTPSCIECWVEVAYGKIALYNPACDKLMVGKDMVAYQDYVALNKYYFGTPSYIYRRVGMDLETD